MLIWQSSSSATGQELQSLARQRCHAISDAIGHLDFIVPNLDEMVGRLCSFGASLDREIQIREYGRMSNMADPFGNGFDLIEFSGPGYDNITAMVSL